LSIAECLVHILSNFEVIESDGVVGKVRSKLDVDNKTIAISPPFWMVVDLFGKKTHLLNECGSLLKRGEFERLGKGIQVSGFINFTPAIYALSSHNHINFIVCHLLKLISA